MNPLKVETWMVELALVPGLSTRNDGFAPSVKDVPVTWTWIKLVLVIPPLIPVTIIT